MTTVVVMGVRLHIKQPCLSSLSQGLSFEYDIFIPEDRKRNEMVLEGTEYKMEADFQFSKEQMMGYWTMQPRTWSSIIFNFR